MIINSNKSYYCCQCLTTRDMPVAEQTGLIIPWREKILSWGTIDQFRKRMLERIDYKIQACIRFFCKVLKDFSLDWMLSGSQCDSSVKLLSRVQLFVTPRTDTCQDPLSVGFSRQEYWIGLPLPSPGESSQPRDRTQVSRTAGRLFTIWATREALWVWLGTFKTFMQD